MRLYCFPHAGAGISAFAGWRSIAASGVEVVPVLLPGRGGRRREPGVTTRAQLLAEVLPRLDTPAHQPFAFYGHSLGGLVAYTAAIALAEAGRPEPALVAVGACPPPTAPVSLAESAELPDGELLDLLRELGAAPPEASPGGIWERTVLGVIRDDLRLARNLRRSAHRPLGRPLLAISGTHDRLAGRDVMAGWRLWSTDRVVQRTLPGDHFFLRDPALPRLLARTCQVARRLQPVTPVLTSPTGAKS